MIALGLLIAALLLLYLSLGPSRPKNFPPGPRWLPLVGCGPHLRGLTRELGYQHLALQQLAKEYGSDVIGLRLGGQLAVVVSGHLAVKQVLTREEFEGRPDNFFIRMRCLGTRKGITCTEGSHWQEQRGFAVRQLRSLGLGRPAMERHIQQQVGEVLTALQLRDGSAVQMDFGPAVMSVLWTLIAGTNFSAEHDPAQGRLLELMHRRAGAFDMAGGVLSQFPWVRHLAPRASGFELLSTVNRELAAFFTDTITAHRETFLIEEEPRDLIDAYLREIDLRKDSPDSTFDEEQLVLVCLDMFVAGATSTSNTLGMAAILLALHPAVQSRAAAEIRDVIGAHTAPAIAHQTRLPYVSAVLLEVLRLCHVTPVAGPRRALRDTELLGYSIPKDTMVLINVWSVHNDSQHWGDPEIFRPERFIDSEGKLKSPDDWIIPFGLGRRRCLGDSLARGCLFLFVSGLLQRFHLEPSSGAQSEPSESPVIPVPVPGITLAPPPFPIILRPRN